MIRWPPLFGIFNLGSFIFIMFCRRNYVLRNDSFSVGNTQEFSRTFAKRRLPNILAATLPHTQSKLTILYVTCVFLLLSSSFIIKRNKGFCSVGNKHMDTTYHLTVGLFRLIFLFHFQWLKASTSMLKRINAKISYEENFER